MMITEIFRSIQGEGTRAGLPCVFVRLTGCNLRCTWCDSAYAFYGGTKMSVGEVCERVRELSRPGPVGTAAAANSNADGNHAGNANAIRLVELTGGEPLLQAETIPLAEKLLAAGYTVMIETSGERFIGKLPKEVTKIVDVKCPDSGAAETFDFANLEALGPGDEVKFVIATRRDYEFAREFSSRHDLAEKVHQVIFSPAFADPAGTWPGLEASELAEWILADGVPVRLGLQLHKFIWDPAMHGV
jgi:7-carboxy-7-deazaguanine synthase